MFYYFLLPTAVTPQMEAGDVLPPLSGISGLSLDSSSLSHFFACPLTLYVVIFLLMVHSLDFFPQKILDNFFVRC